MNKKRWRRIVRDGEDSFKVESELLQLENNLLKARQDKEKVELDIKTEKDIKKVIYQKFKNRFIEKKSNLIINQLYYFNFGSIDFNNLLSNNGKVSVFNINKEEFLYINNFNPKEIESLYTFLGFSESGKNIEEGYDYIIEEFVLIYDKSINLLNVFRGWDLELDFKIKCDNKSWKWIIEEFFIGKEF